MERFSRAKLGASTVNVWWFVVEFIDEHGYAPTLREVAAGCFFTPPAARKHLLRLVEAGVLTMQPRKWRTLQVVEYPPN